MSDIVISEFMNEAAINDILSGRDLLYDPKLVDKPQELIAALKDCRALIVRNRTQVRNTLLDHAPRLKVVGRLGVGLDNIDTDSCRSRGIQVFPASGANDLSVAEYVLTASLMLLRRAWTGSAQVVGGDWPREKMMGRELNGKALGLVGFGAIARLTATKMRGLGVYVSAYDPFLKSDASVWQANQVQSVSLETLLASSDIVSLHVPLTEQTRRMIGASAFARMKQGAILINAARGGIVDEAALVTALKGGQLYGAALDVFENEPVSAEYGAVFQGVPNLILTPHIAGITEESNVRVSRVTCEKVAAALDAL